MKKVFFTVPFVIILAGCANFEAPIEPGYTGPTAIVNDTQLPQGNTRAQFFVIEEVDGKRVDNALIESRRASNGRGLTLVGRNVSRELAVRPLRLKLLATEETGAPIEAIFRAATGNSAPSAEGVVEFVPQEGHQYIVTGEMSTQASSVWVQDLATADPVTEKIVSAGSRRAEGAGASKPAPSETRPKVVCDKWGNPMDEHGNPCR
jgi:hypothetical protein